MTTERYLPYRSLRDRLTLTPTLEVGEVPLSATGEVLAYELEDDPLKLTFRINDWRDDVDDVLPSKEWKSPPVTAFLIFRAVQARRRFAVALEALDHVQEFARCDWRGSVEARAVVVRNRDGDVSDGSTAIDKASILISSKPRIVHFDEPPRPPGDHLEVLWEDFRGSPDPWRRRHPDNIFALDLSGERPIVLLNEGFANLKFVLNNGATHGRAARIRDATNFMIAHQVWASLIASAMQAVRDASAAAPDRPLAELTEELTEWERKILEDWSRPVYAEFGAEEALDRMLRACLDADGMQTVMVRLPNAVQTRLTTMRGFNGLVRDSHLFAES